MASEAPKDDSRVQETHFTAPDHNDAEANRIEATEAPTANGTTYGSVPGGPAATAAVLSQSKQSARVLGPDLLRGLLMILQSLDHGALTLGAWQHGVAVETEGDGTIVNHWNIPQAWVARTLTHLCAPGFMFLLGMGVVYFGRSRTKLGWPAWKMIRHFAIRAIVLIIINQLLAITFFGLKLMLFNIVLVALAVNYFLAGIIWLVINASEHYLSRLLDYWTTDKDARRPLLTGQAQEAQTDRDTGSRTANMLWHINNVVLLALAVVTIWWNVWFSPHEGHCLLEQSQPSKSLWFTFWFYSVRTEHVMSGFPPLAWLSFAILGLLYGRIVTARPWKPAAVNASNAAFGVVLLVLFVFTRLFQFGNLSEDCLQMPEQLAHPDKNQYLVSFRSFFYIIKYPPSVAYFCFTMGLNHLLLAMFGALPANVSRNIPTLMNFGTSALFFYVAHLLLLMLVSRIVNPLFGHDLGRPDMRDPTKNQVGLGPGPGFWVTWLAVLAILNPLCKWYGRFKSSKGADSIWRFF